MISPRADSRLFWFRLSGLFRLSLRASFDRVEF